MKNIKRFINDFSDFIANSNFIEVAVGVLIAGAIKDMANAFTINIITPMLNALAAQLGLNVDPNSSVSILGMNLGIIAFLSSILTFFVILFVAYLIIKIYAGFKMRYNKEQVEVELSEKEYLKAILDELKESNNNK
jgi:large conductance mechanosensitive channel